MKRSLAFALTLGMVSIAAAETSGSHPASPLADDVDAPANPLATPWSRPQATYRVMAPDEMPVYRGPEVAHAAPGFSNVIYLNNCLPNGCTVTPGNDNSLNNTSIIPRQQSVVQPYAFNNWAQVVECVKQTYAPFGVEIVDQRPTSGNYHMAIVAGRPGDVQMQNGVGGVSPFTCGYIPNAISFSFANIYGGSVDDICWTVAQETAHSWGLDHKFDNRDPMTYLQSGPSRKTFQNQAGPCGEFSARNCQCGGNQMNSFVEIMQTFGGSTPTPPTVNITAPADGATGLAAGFPIRADATDDIAINKVELRIDNVLVSTLTVAPFVWNAPTTLANGNHTIEVTAYDVGNTPASDKVVAAIGTPCTSAAQCDDNFTCVDGRCVAGGGIDGGLGTGCTGNADCASNQCASDGTDSYCVENCDPSANGCPSGFTCITTGADLGVCWPGGSGGGCTTGAEGSGTPLAVLGFLGMGGLLITRRRRSR